MKPSSKPFTHKCPKCNKLWLGRWMVSERGRKCIWCGHEWDLRPSKEPGPKTEEAVD